MCETLIRVYFARSNPYLRILDERDFRALFSAGLHKSEEAFAALAWTVFAIGSRGLPGVAAGDWGTEPDPVGIHRWGAGWRFAEEAVTYLNSPAWAPMAIFECQTLVVSHAALSPLHLR